MPDAPLTRADLFELRTQLERRFDTIDMRLDKADAEARARFAEVYQHMAEMEVRLEKSLTRTGWIAGIVAGFIAAIPAYIAVSMALIRLFGGHIP